MGHKRTTRTAMPRVSEQVTKPYGSGHHGMTGIHAKPIAPPTRVRGRVRSARSVKKL